MKDDYLWDGSGDIDPEVERLENLLGRYRHTGTAPRMPVAMMATPRRFNWTRLAIAAALVLTLAGALLLALNYGAGDSDKEIIADRTEQPAPESKDLLYRQPPLVVTPPAAEPKQAIAAAKPAPRSIKRKPEKVASPADDPWQFSSTAAMADLETARYLERAEVLLRSFRNVSETGESIDVALEKEQSRDLLYKNILLRRTAEAKGNLPVSDLLGSLEPILIDIANLPESPTRQEVQLIKDFIRQKEMVATIQVYSSPAISVDAR
jgi:hypothetical protein